MERIAVEAGTSKGTALYHFANKEEIYAGVINTLFDAGRAYMVEHILAATTPRERFVAYVESNLRFIVDNVEHVVATQRIAQHLGDVDLDEAIPPLRELLAAGQQDGSFADFDTDIVAHAIRALIDAAAFYLTDHLDLDGDQFVAEGVALMLRTVGATGTDPR